MKKVLIIQTAFIGDVILATSLIESIKKYWPEAQVDFLLRKGNESLLKNSPHINEVFIWEKNTNKFSSLVKNIISIRKRKYDYVLNIQRFFNAALMTSLSGAKIKVGFDKSPLSFLYDHKVAHLIPHKQDENFLHEVQRNLQLYQKIEPKVKLDVERPRLYFSKKEEVKINDLNLTTPYIVIAPSSVWFTKQWHISKWKELIEQTPSHFKIILIGAPSDNPYVSMLENKINTINLCGKLSLLESALLMKRAHRVLVNDSAPLHLASSVNAKTTAIFCSTVPDFGYFPLSEDSKLIQLQPRLACMPCGLHGKTECPLKHFNCSNQINVKDVLATYNISKS